MRRELMEQKMNRPELLTRRPDPTSPSSRRRRALLRVILLPLEIVESADQVPVPAVDEVAPFLPACISAPTATGDDGPHAQLLAFRHIVDRSKPPIAFGLALDGQRAPDGPQRRYVGPPATCLSLWEVPGNGLVLACEELTPDRAGGLIDRHDDPLRGGGSPEFWTAIETFLRPFGLTPESSPIDIFPRLDTRLPRSAVYRPLRSLTMHGPHRTDRGTLEGLVIEVHIDGVDTVRRLVDDPSTTPCTGAESRSCRRHLRWHRAALTDRASRLGSGLAIREDARVLAVDVGAAYDPGYLGQGTREMLYCLIGWVALRAQHSADHRRVLSLLRNRHHLNERDALAGLRDIAAARTRMVETRLLQTHPTGAHRPARIESTHLRSMLVHRTADEIAVLHTALGELCDSAESSLLPHALASARDRRSTLVAVAAAGALFATSLHVAVAASPEDLQRWGFTVAVTAAIGAVPLLAAVARRRPSGTLRIQTTPAAIPRASPDVKPVKDLERRRRESIFPFETHVWRTAPKRRDMTPTLRECRKANNLSGFEPSNPPLVVASPSSRPEPK